MATRTKIFRGSLEKRQKAADAWEKTMRSISGVNYVLEGYAFDDGVTTIYYSAGAVPPELAKEETLDEHALSHY